MIGGLAWLGPGSGSGRTLYPEMDCPPGMRPTLVTECAWSYPIYECVWLNGAVADCHIKRWECAATQHVWKCEYAFSVAGG
jgi:hypothetical protein